MPHRESMDFEPSTTSAVPLDSPTELGRYRLLANVGRGGMSDVYLACIAGPGDFSKLLVIKVLRSSLVQDRDFIHMFLDEARLAARFSHPNVVQTFEVSNDNSRYFMAMEFLDGQPLSQVMARLRGRERLAAPTVARIVSDTLAGLHYTHELTDYDGAPMLVVHRDVTPQNIFLTYDGQVKLMDFGIAKAAPSVEETRVGILKGKIGYMSPEQARGEKVDRRADIFAAGVVLIEALSDKRLWQGRNEFEILRRLADGDVPPVESVLGPGDTHLHRICRRALSPERRDRYPSAAAMQRELEIYLDSLERPADLKKVGYLLRHTFALERDTLRAVVMGQLKRMGVDSKGPQNLREPREPAVPPHPSTLATPVASATAPATETAETPLEPKAPLEANAPSDASIHEAPTKVFAAPIPPRNPWRRRALAFGGVGAALVATIAVAVQYDSRHQDREQDGSPDNTQRSDPIRAERRAAPSLRATSPAAVGSAACQAANKPLVELSGDIEGNATLDCTKDYLLRFTTFVRPGATLTIQPGTVLRGDDASDGTLVVQPGARLIAKGTREHPIVFTSAKPPEKRAPGDWGGLIVLGNAPVNLRDARGNLTRGRIEGITTGGEYGGTEPNDNSGVLEFVRIEYAGDEIAPNNEINGLTFGGVGAGTSVNYVQVRHSSDDCFEFFGGTVNAKHLICESPGDDGFDWDYGYHGKLQFLLMIAQSQAAVGDSNGFEGDNDPNGSNNKPVSAPVISNFTLCGNGNDSGHESYGILLRRGTRGTMLNGMVGRFSAGLDVRDATTDVDLRSTFFFANVLHPLAFPERADARHRPMANDDNGFDEVTWVKQKGRSNGITTTRLLPCKHEAGGFKPKHPLTETAAPPPPDPFFDASAQYLGAFRDAKDDWDAGNWTVFADG